MPEPIRLPVHVRVEEVRCLSTNALDATLYHVEDGAGVCVAECGYPEHAEAIRDALNAQAPAQAPAVAGLDDDRPLSRVAYDAAMHSLARQSKEVGALRSFENEAWSEAADAVRCRVPSIERARLRGAEAGMVGQRARIEALEAEIAVLNAQAPSVAGLDVETLAAVVKDASRRYWDTHEEAFRTNEEVGHFCQGHDEALAAVRDHILHTLAAMAGDPEALGKTALDAYYKDNRVKALPWEMHDDYGRRMWTNAAQAVAAAVEAHDRTLVERMAGEAGDAEALARAAHEAVGNLYRTRRVLDDYEVVPWDELDDPVQEEYRAEVMAVAARIQAAAEVRERGLREALAEIRRLLTEEWSANPDWRRGNEQTYSGRIDLLAESALATTPDVGRLEAEARLGRAALAYLDTPEGPPSKPLETGEAERTCTEFHAALAALRARDGDAS